jgi:PAS domain S-box-containing protein
MLQEITSTLDLDRILQSVLREAVQFSGAEAGMVALHEDGALHLQAMEGYDEGRREGLVEMAQRSHQYDFLVDFIERPQPHYFPDLSEGQGWWTPLDARSVFMAPVIYEGEPAAILLIQSEHPDAFPEAVQEFVEGLATQTAVAVGNARQYAAQLERSEWVQRRVEQMRLLLEMTRTMRSDRPLEEVLQDMAYATQEAVGYGIVLISIRQGEVAQRIAGAGMTMTELERLKQSPTPWVRIETIMQERFRIGQSYYIPAEHQEVWRSNDIDAYEMPHEDVERVPGRWHPQDVLLVPLYNMQGKVLGYMSVDAPESGAVPNRNTLEVLELFAAQLALAIENSELVDHLRLQLNTVTLFNELNRSITSKLDLSMVLNTVVQAVTNLLDYDYSTIFLQDRATQRFVPQASSGYDLEMLGDLSFAPAGGLIGSVVKTSMPLVSEDVQNDPRFVPGPIPIGSSILVPLITEGHTIGVLAADRKGKGDFSPREVATLTALADQVSVAVENARLFEEVTHFSEELEERVAERTEELGEALESLRVERDRTEVLYRIASELVASLDLDQVLYKTLALLRNTVGAQRGSILVFDPQREALMQRASIGEPAMPPGGRPVPFEWQSSLAGWVVEEGRSAIVDDAREDERWLQREGKESTRSVLAVPIPGGAGEVHGAILLHSNEINAFDEAHRRLVEAAGVQLGNAINNAELYRLIREQAERLGAMLRTQQVEAAKSEAILEAIADGVMVTDAQGRVILFNAAAEIILSIHREEALGRVMDEMLGLYGSEARDWLTQVRQWREIPTSYESGAYLAAEFEMGRQVVSVHLAPVISAGDEFLGTVSIFRDITAEVEADRAKTEFVSTVSHELRTPMTSIKGYTDLLLMGTSGDLNDMQRHFLGVIKVNADRLSGLVNDLLDLSRMETGKVELAPEPIDVGALVEQVALTIKPEAAEKGLSIYAVVPEGLPHAYGDPARVTQILTNLVNNAYKYTPSGGEISVHAYVKDAKLHVAVADTGIGISADNQRKIFDRFFRVDDPLVQEVSGTGLGLAITLTLIHMHGGELLVESELGEGSIFTFNLPLAEGEPTAEVGKPPADYALTPPATVLVVEDDLEVAELLRLTLENEGRRVLLAPTGKDALRMAREEGPDVISLDILLPDMNGFQVLERLKEDEATANIPVIVVSAVTEAQRGLDLGAVAYLPKPVDIGQITEVVNANLVSEGTVLVVDDDPGVLTLLREALRAQGLGVRTTGQGKRGLHLAQDIQPALVLLDLKLPDMDGYDVLRQLKGSRRTADIPVIVMTGMMPSPTTSEEVKRAGALKYLTKPLSVVELAEEISHLVDGQNGNKE